MGFTQTYRAIISDGNSTDGELDGLFSSISEAGALRRDGERIASIDNEALDLYVLIRQDMESFSFNRPVLTAK